MRLDVVLAVIDIALDLDLNLLTPGHWLKASYESALKGGEDLSRAEIRFLSMYFQSFRMSWKECYDVRYPSDPDKIVNIIPPKHFGIISDWEGSLSLRSFWISIQNSRLDLTRLEQAMETLNFQLGYLKDAVHRGGPVAHGESTPISLHGTVILPVDLTGPEYFFWRLWAFDVEGFSLFRLNSELSDRSTYHASHVRWDAAGFQTYSVYS